MTRGAGAVAPDVESWSASDVLAYAVERFHPRLYLACSFQKESSVIIDLLLEIEPRARIFTLDTGVLFPETYATWRRIEEHYGIQVDAYRGISLQRQALELGHALWERDPDRCCATRKETPLERALAKVDAWIGGLRRGQSPERAATPKLGWDAVHRRWKVSPLADWSERDVWDHIEARGLPYNPLHDAGYASIGCTHCTQPGVGRAGRWPDRAKTECGIHRQVLGQELA